MASAAFIDCKHIVKVYKIDTHEVVALKGIDFKMDKGEMVAIIGPSGAGKSSLLNLLGGLDTPTAGQLSVGGLDLLKLKGKSLAEYRLKRVGFLWQQVERNLLPNRSAFRNVTLPMLLAGSSPSERRHRAAELLEAVGLAEYANKLPSHLSGGQQQRVGIAVALANHPDLMLLDEPTGALDRTAAGQVMDLLHDLRSRYGLTVLMVTHDLHMAAYADRVLTLRDGALGQDLTHGSDETPMLDSSGRITLPEAVRQQLSDAPRISVEIRPEGILLRPESDQAEDTSALLQDMLPQDAPPERHRFRLLRLFRRRNVKSVDETRKAG
ncbi:MAG TPA: ATP-binding cassette domain-containing protein [Aggregatilineales bacterium]|nr:ATP-binding cassette domain-containing protein [Aggregatilineales bacterium]